MAKILIRVPDRRILFFTYDDRVSDVDPLIVSIQERYPQRDGPDHHVAPSGQPEAGCVPERYQYGRIAGTCGSARSGRHPAP